MIFLRDLEYQKEGYSFGHTVRVIHGHIWAVHLRSSILVKVRSYNYVIYAQGVKKCASNHISCDFDSTSESHANRPKYRGLGFFPFFNEDTTKSDFSNLGGQFYNKYTKKEVGNAFLDFEVYHLVEKSSN